jgi:hypothetical protein
MQKLKVIIICINFHILFYTLLLYDDDGNL